MKIEDLILEKREQRETFSVHSIMNEYKLTEEEAKKLCLEASKDERVTVYYFVLCSKCKTKVAEGKFDSTILGKQRNCFSCKASFIVSDKDLEFVYDTRTLKEKLKVML